MPLVEQRAGKVHDSIAHHDGDEPDWSPWLGFELCIEPLANGCASGRAFQMREDLYCPVSKVQFAPPPAFCMISFGSIVQRNFEMLSMLEPAAP